MKKLKIILTTVILLWMAAFFISLGFGDDSEIITNGIAIVPIKGIISPEDSNDFLSGSGMGSDTIINNLKKALDEAMVIASSGNTILFSPAFTSFGLFKNEYDRNDQFLEIVKNL